MASNFIQSGHSMTLTPAVKVTAGDGYLFGDGLFGIALHDVEANKAGAFGTVGVWQLSKQVGQAIADGEAVIWDSVNKRVSTSGSGPRIGVAQAALATSGFVHVRLDHAPNSLTYKYNQVTGRVINSDGAGGGYIGGVGVKNPSGLSRFFTALAQAEYRPVRINCMPDSLTLGTYSNDSSIPVDAVADANGYVGRLRNILARKFGANPAGFIAANDSRNTVSGTGAVTLSVGPIINSVRVDATPQLGGTLPLPAAATITVPVPASTTIEIWYMDSSTNSTAGGTGVATGAFSYSVDGGGSTTTTADSVSPVNYKKITISGLANTTHSLLLTGVSATCYIVGVFYHSGAGAIVSRFGLGGATSLDITACGIVTHLAAGATQRIKGVYSPPLAPALITGAITNGSAVVSGIASTAGILPGMPVGASAGIKLPCFVQSVDSASQITLTSPATQDNAARTMYVGAGAATLVGDLWIVPIGHNDWQQQNSAWPTPVPVFKAELQAFIDMVSLTGGCVLLIGEPKSNTASPTPETYAIESYWSALDELAVANPDTVATLQINRYFGTFDAAKDRGLLSVAGGVHPLKKGAALMAQTIGSVLVNF